MRRKIGFALAFWLLLAGFIALDWSRSPRRATEPPPWALGQPAGDASGHCAAPLK